MGDVLVIAGATATGKTGLALELAGRMGAEIVNADALQVYRGLDIGTAKPTPEQRRAVPHHLIDILEPDETFSAGEYARLARRAIAEIEARDRQPIVVGGSGLYLRALVHGMLGLPEIDPEVREALRREHREEGLEQLRRRLEALDPATAARLAPGDTQRTLRALEVVISTGRPLSEWLSREGPEAPRLSARWLGLTLPRAVLYDRVERRIGRMMADGWLAEVESLLHRGLTLSAPAFQAIGYRQLAGHVRGEWSIEEAVEDTVRATRRYAKRQETWFRKEPDIEWFAAEDLNREAERIQAILALWGMGRADG